MEGHSLEAKILNTPPVACVAYVHVLLTVSRDCIAICTLIC